MPRKNLHKKAQRSSQQDANLINAAAESGDIPSIEALLARGVDINACDDGQGLRPLITAAKCGQISAVRMLIEKGAKLDATATYEYPTDYEGFTALMAASEQGHVDCVKALVNAGADVNFGDESDGTNAMILAARNGNLEVVRYLLSAQAKISRVAFGQAIKHHHPQIVELLLSNGASYLRDDKKGRLLAMAFAGLAGRAELQRPQLEMLNVLLAAGADVNAANEYGVTPLMFVIGKENQNAAIRLIRAGADVNARTKTGETAMHFAAGSGLISIVEELIKVGADHNCRNEKGELPVDEAVRLDRSEMVKFLSKGFASRPSKETKHEPAASKAPAAQLASTSSEEKDQVTEGFGAHAFLSFIQDWGHPEWVVLAVEAPLDMVTTRYASSRPGERVLFDVEIKRSTKADDEMSSDIVLAQSKGSAWTTIFQSLSLPIDDEDFEEGERLACELSLALKTRALVFIGEDTSDAMGYILYRNGEKIDACEWASQSDSADRAFATLGIYVPACYPRRAENKIWLAAMDASLQRIQRANLIEFSNR